MSPGARHDGGATARRGIGARPFRRGRAAAAALALLAVLAGCGDGGGDDGSIPSVVLLARPTGEPADDEAELAPDRKSAVEEQIESSPLPAPELPSETPDGDRAEPVALAAGGVRRLCFSPISDCMDRLLRYVQAETVGIDVAIYHLYDSRLSRLLVAKHRAGVRVRVLADRHAYTAKAPQAREMNRLAAGGVPVRTNRHRGILHHKVTLLHGLGLVEHGSMNYTAVASRKVPAGGGARWNDEVAFFTTTPRVFARFRERFERMWANSGGGREAFQPFTAGMTLPDFEETEAARPTTRYENPSPDPRPRRDDPALRVCFAPDQHCVRDVVAPIVRTARTRLDVIMFRATSYEFAAPLIGRVRAGLPVRLIFDRAQYGTAAYPTMTRIIDDLRAAGTGGNLRLKATAHPGHMHMKSLVTPEVATWGSGNFSRSSSKRVRGLNRAFYQDEDMVIARDPALVAAMQARFDEMWEGGGFADFD